MTLEQNKMGKQMWTGAPKGILWNHLMSPLNEVIIGTMLTRHVKYVH